jgi:hypothetical protein
MKVSKIKIKENESKKLLIVDNNVFLCRYGM